MTFTYAAKNTGATTLKNIAITDDKIAASKITCTGTTSNIIPVLAPGAAASCTASAVATVGLYVNTGTATGTGYSGSGTAVTPVGSVTATDKAHYTATWPDHAIYLTKLSGSAPIAGSNFTIYDTDPSTAGAAPIANGIQPDTGGSTFTSVPLKVPGTYWLVETKAPNGHQLLADPIPFTLDQNRVTLTGAQGANITVDPGNGYRIRVQDTPAPNLPHTGGPGTDLPWPALLVLTGAGLLGARRVRVTR